MPINEIVQRLESWKDCAEKLEAQMDYFRELTGATVESIFLDSIYSVLEAYTASVGELIGDKEEWLNWYMYECEMGCTPREVTFADGKTINVRTLRQLARVIRHD